MKDNHGSNSATDFQQKVRKVEYVMELDDEGYAIKVIDEIKYEVTRVGKLVIIANLN